MLEELSIRDFALIDRLQLRFERGFNLLSGETGAGKSILIGALGFILGAKAETGIIRSGAEETLVSGVISLDGNAEAAEWLAARGIDCEEGSVVIRRSLRQNGRGSLYIQSAPVTRADLAAFTALLVDVHGQHEHQSLLSTEAQRRLVDRYAGIDGEVKDYAAAFSELCERKRALEQLEASVADRERRIELLEYQIRELEEAKLREGEEEELDEEGERLSHFEKLHEHAELAREVMHAAGEGALPRLRQARTALAQAAAIDPRLADLSRRLDDAFYELEDCSESLSTYLSGMRFSPERLDQVQTRLAEIHRLRKKYGGTVKDLMLKLEDACRELERLREFEQDRGGLEAGIAALEAKVWAQAESLSARRKAAAAPLEARIAEIVRTLGMPKAGFRIALTRKPDDGGKAVVGPTGFDLVEFLIAPNPGEPPKPLSRIASGGELSRVMLAVKTVLAEADSIATLVFDEIDTGIGGEVAVAVGQHLQSLSASRQVFCITHLASIAARADNHLKVEKGQEGGRTLTRVARIEGKERVAEIARMLSGKEGGEASLRHAEELLSSFARKGG